MQYEYVGAIECLLAGVGILLIIFFCPYSMAGPMA